LKQREIFYHKSRKIARIGFINHYKLPAGGISERTKKKRVANPDQKFMLLGICGKDNFTFQEWHMMTPWIKTIREAVGVMLLALILAGAGFILRPHLRPLLSGAGPGDSDSVSSTQGTAPTVSLNEARAYFKAGTALFADARPSRAYQAGHIQGAMNLDPDEFDTWSGAFFSQFPADTLIITYCDGTRCPLSTELAEKLISLGYEKVLVLKNGWSLWKAAHLPTE
jgi:rhodanese-related sulfurtransferase